MMNSENRQPLSDLRIIDLTHGIAGPYSTKLLADFGAEVIKVEKPGNGDYSRLLGPYPEDIQDIEKSGIFLYLNTNKKSVTLDLGSSKGIEIFKKLVANADIVIESFKPGVADKLGIGYESLKSINPELVMTSISNFGQDGPYRDYEASELIMYAMGGSMSRTGLDHKYPIKLGGSHVLYQAGNNAAMASLLAWYGKKYMNIGGQHLDVSIFETQMGSINMRTIGLISYQYNGLRTRRMGAYIAGYPMGVYPCKDGFISVAGGGQRFARVANSIDRPELVEDPRYGTATGAQDIAYKDEFEKNIWIPWLMERTRDEVVARCQQSDLLCTHYNSVDQVVDDCTQLLYREYFVDVEHPKAGSFKYPGSPVFNNNGWWKIGSPAPLLGQHNKEIIGDLLGYSDEYNSAVTSTTTKKISSAQVDSQSANTSEPNDEVNSAGYAFPLEGIRVVDMTVVLAGPYGTMFLGDMGAEIIRIETVNQLSATSRGQFAHPDPIAEKKALQSPYPNQDPGDRPWNRYAGFNAHGRHKYGMTAELRTEEGRAAFRKLIESSDFFIENNAVGSMARLGFTYDVLSKWNPRIIMISVTGFGQTGPWSTYKGIGTSFEAAYGHAAVMGYPDMGTDGVPLTVPADAACGVMIANAAVVALHQREKTGKGMLVDISLGENFIPHLGEIFMDYTINGRVAKSTGNRDHMGHMVQGVYQCAGDDEWIAISIENIEKWHKLCKVINRSDLETDNRFNSMDKLKENHDQFDKIIGEWSKDKNPIDIFHILQSEGIIAGPLLHEVHAYADPHLKHRDFFKSVTHPEIGTYPSPGSTFKMPKAPFSIRKAPVRMGEDNDHVYLNVLGYSEEQYSKLKDLGHIGMDYAPHVK